RHLNGCLGFISVAFKSLRRIYYLLNTCFCNTTQRTAYDLYNNPDQLPSSTVLSKICDTYEVQPGEVLEWVPKSEKPGNGNEVSVESLQSEDSEEKRGLIKQKPKSKSHMQLLPPEEAA
uniref:helix-turn-helix domain-containing protein n=1 Tax=Nostoc sp. MG11 TaxID=2721166 RepID=UPI001D01A7DC